jgi:hypothetical protein
MVYEELFLRVIFSKLLDELILISINADKVKDPEARHFPSHTQDAIFNLGPQEQLI